ncbi:MAG: hypothetical protein NTY83_00370 [Candidatus Micrarchaeota archaeon]|nr:hypothetical protein [Candidatus Micrarchaeota archaeon]
MLLKKNECTILSILLNQKKAITAGELAANTGIQKSNLSAYIQNLSQYRLILVSKQGRIKAITAQYGHFVEFSRLRNIFPNLKIEDILVGRMPLLLAFLHRYSKTVYGKKSSFTIKDIDLPPITSSRLLKKLSSLGLVYSISRGHYVLRSGAYAVTWFCTNILSEIYSGMAENDLQGIERMLVSFSSANGPELIFVTTCPNSSEKYWPTAYTVLSDYGVKIISAGRYYYSNIRPEIADVVMHILAIGTDARNIAFAAALMSRNQFVYTSLLSKKNRFTIHTNFINSLINFVETKGKFRPDGFPNWEEVEAV